jgi:hypothetical protein
MAGRMGQPLSFSAFGGSAPANANDGWLDPQPRALALRLDRNSKRPEAPLPSSQPTAKTLDFHRYIFSSFSSSFLLPQPSFLH